MVAPRSKQFDDVYFSEQDGLAETTHVFLQGNDLAQKLESYKNETDSIVICETGFGTGLNFLAAWKCLLDNALQGVRLHFISFDKFPLSAKEIDNYLDRWREHFPYELALLVEHYPDPTSGTHHIQLNDRVTLSLIIGDVNDEIPQLQADVDVWFLDGFKPSANPDMWSETVFEHMARLSHAGTSLATFTAAGFVRRGLQAVGFDIQKVPGFGRKREMVIGTFNPTGGV